MCWPGGSVFLFPTPRILVVGWAVKFFWKNQKYLSIHGHCSRAVLPFHAAWVVYFIKLSDMNKILFKIQSSLLKEKGISGKGGTYPHEMRNIGKKVNLLVRHQSKKQKPKLFNWVKGPSTEIESISQKYWGAFGPTAIGGWVSLQSFGHFPKVPLIWHCFRNQKHWPSVLTKNDLFSMIEISHAPLHFLLPYR